MSTAFCIPWRYAPKRIRSFGHLMERLKGLPVYFGDSAPGEFSRAQAANRAVKRALADGHEMIVVNDADTLWSPDSLWWAVVLTAQDGIPRLPYDKYVLMNEEQTAAFYEGEDLPREPVYEGSVSGVLVFRSDSWIDIGGFDERYRGWGHEDNDMAARAKFERVSGYVWSLYHEPDDRSISDPRNLKIYKETHGL